MSPAAREVGAPAFLKDNVDLEGSGQGRTTITCACALAAGSRSTLYAGGGIGTEVRHLTVTNPGGAANVSVALELDGTGASFSVIDTTLSATNGSGPSFSAMTMWIRNGASHPHIDHVSGSLG